MTDEQFDDFYARYKDETVAEVMRLGFLPADITNQWMKDDLKRRLSERAGERLSRIAPELREMEIAFKKDGVVTVWNVYSFQKIGRSLTFKTRFAGQYGENDEQGQL